MVKVGLEKAMPVDKVKKKLEKLLPKFTFTTGEEAGQPEENWLSINARRDGLEMAVNVARVTNSADVKSLAKYISRQWEGASNGNK